MATILISILILAMIVYIIFTFLPDNKVEKGYAYYFKNTNDNTFYLAYVTDIYQAYDPNKKGAGTYVEVKFVTLRKKGGKDGEIVFNLPFYLLNAERAAKYDNTFGDNPNVKI
jgi:hypothetical protein